MAEKVLQQKQEKLKVLAGASHTSISCALMAAVPIPMRPALPARCAAHRPTLCLRTSISHTAPLVLRVPCMMLMLTPPLQALVDQAEKGSSNAASIGLFDVLWDLPPLLLASPSVRRSINYHSATYDCALSLYPLRQTTPLYCLYFINCKLRIGHSLCERTLATHRPSPPLQSSPLQFPRHSCHCAPLRTPSLMLSPQRDKEVTAAYFKLLTRAVEIDVGGAARRLIIASLVSLYSFGTPIIHAWDTLYTHSWRTTAITHGIHYTRSACSVRPPALSPQAHIHAHTHAHTQSRTRTHTHQNTSTTQHSTPRCEPRPADLAAAPTDATSSLMQVQRAYAAQLANPRTPSSRVSGLIGVARLFAMRGAKVANLASDSTSLALRYVRAPEAPGTHSVLRKSVANLLLNGNVVWFSVCVCVRVVVC